MFLLCLLNIQMIVDVEAVIQFHLLAFNKTPLGARCAALPSVWTRYLAE